MSRALDVDLVLREYLADDGLTAPDYVLDVVEEQIGRQRQRRAWPFPGRTTMNNQVKLLVGLAAAVVVAVVGYRLLPGIGGTGATPPPSPTAVTIPSLSPTLIPALPDGTLSAGVYRLAPLASAPSLRIDATVPAGWQGFGSWAILSPRGSAAPQGTGIGFIAADGIYSDPCHWDKAGDGSWPQAGIQVGPTVDDLANALRASTAYTSTTPVAITLGGYAGKRIDLQLPSEITGCDIPRADTAGRYFVFSGADAGNYAQGPNNRIQVWIVDAGGTRLIVLVGDYAATPEADRVAASSILDSLVIRP